MTNQNQDQPYDNIIMEMDEGEAVDHDIIFMLGEFGEWIDHAAQALECFNYDEEKCDMIRLQLLRASLKLHAKGILDGDSPILKLATHDPCSVIRQHALTCDSIRLQQSTQSLNLHMTNTEDPYKLSEICELEAQPRFKTALIQKTFDLSRPPWPACFLTQDENWTRKEQLDCHDDDEYDDHDEEDEDAGESDYDEEKTDTEESDKDCEYHHYVQCDYDGCDFCEYEYINEECEQIRARSLVSHDDDDNDDDDDDDDCGDDHGVKEEEKLLEMLQRRSDMKNGSECIESRDVYEKPRGADKNSFQGPSAALGVARETVPQTNSEKSSSDRVESTANQPHLARISTLHEVTPASLPLSSSPLSSPSSSSSSSSQSPTSSSSRSPTSFRMSNLSVASIITTLFSITIILIHSDGPSTSSGKAPDTKKRPGPTTAAHRVAFSSRFQPPTFAANDVAFLPLTPSQFKKKESTARINTPNITGTVNFAGNSLGQLPLAAREEKWHRKQGAPLPLDGRHNWDPPTTTIALECREGNEPPLAHFSKVHSTLQWQVVIMPEENKENEKEKLATRKMRTQRNINTMQKKDEERKPAKKILFCMYFQGEIMADLVNASLNKLRVAEMAWKGVPIKDFPPEAFTIKCLEDSWTLLKTDNAGPQDGLEYWKSRAARLTLLIEQINTHSCKMTLKAGQSKLLKPWREIDLNITRYHMEAVDNTKFLGAIERSSHPGNMKQPLRRLLHIVKMIYNVSTFYNSSEREAPLLVKITNQVICSCKRYITESGRFTIWYQDREMVKDHDYLDFRNQHFDKDYRDFLNKMESLTKRLRTKLELTHDGIWDSPHFFQYLTRFEKPTKVLPILYHIKNFIDHFEEEDNLKKMPEHRKLVKQYNDTGVFLMKFELQEQENLRNPRIHQIESMFEKPILKSNNVRDLTVNFDPFFHNFLKGNEKLCKLDIPLPSVNQFLIKRKNWFFESCELPRAEPWQLETSLDKIKERRKEGSKELHKRSAMVEDTIEQFKAGMKLEAVDPLNLATICVATVMKILRHGYIMIRMDGYESDPTGGDWFCYHGSSPFVFPPGFCDRNNIKLKDPAGFEGDFQWPEYLKTTKSEAAPMVLFSHKDDCKHGFKVDMKVECTDLMDPRLVCVSTINRVVNRLLKVHFDGWEEDYDQWMDCKSVDIYPVGWCELVGHRLEGPRMKIPPAKKLPAKEKKRKSGGAANGRKVNKVRKKHSNASPGDVEELAGELEAASRSPTPTPPVLQPEVEPASEEQPQEEEQVQEEQVQEAAQPQVEEEAVEENEEMEEQQQEVQEEEEEKYIPRLLDAAGNATPRSRDQSLEPESWTVKNLASFLEVNECSNLMTSYKTELHFIRCVVPNTHKQPEGIESGLMMHQYTCNDVLAGIAICRADFPNKLAYPEFQSRYDIIGTTAVTKAKNDKAAAQAVMGIVKLGKEKFRLDHILVFFRTGIGGWIEEQRENKIGSVLAWLQSGARGKMKEEEQILSFDDKCNHLNELKIRLEKSLDEVEDSWEHEKKKKGDIKKLKRQVEGNLKLTKETVTDLERNKIKMGQVLQRKEKERNGVALELEEIQQQLGNDQNKKMALEKQGKMIQQQIYDAQGRQEEPQRTLHEADGGKRKITGENCDLVHQFEEAERTAATLSKDRSSLTTQLEDAKRLADAETRERINLLGKMRNLQHRLEVLKRHLEEEADAKMKVEKQLSKAFADIQLWKTRYETEGVAHCEEIDKDKTKVAGRLAEAEDTVSSLQEKIASLEKAKACTKAEFDDLKAEAEKRDRNFDKIVNEWRLKAEDLQNEITSSQTECRNFSPEYFRVKSANEELMEHLDTVKRGNENLTEEIKNLLDQLGERLRDEIKNLEATIEKCEEDENTTDSQIRTLRDEISHQGDLIGKLGKEKKSTGEPRQKTEEDIQIAEDCCNHLSMVKSMLEQSLDECKNTLEREKKSKADVEKSKRKVGSDLKLTQDAVSDLERVNTELSQTVQRKEKEMSSILAKIDDEHTLGSKYSKQVKELQSCVDELDEELAIERTSRAKAEKDRSLLSRDLEDLGTRLEEAGSNTSTQIELNKKHEDELSKLKVDLDEANIAHEGTLAALRQKHNNSMASLGEQIDGINKDKAGMERDLQEARGGLEGAMRDRANMEKKCKMSQALIVEPNQKLDELARALNEANSTKKWLQVESQDLNKQIEENKNAIANLTEAETMRMKIDEEAEKKNDVLDALSKAQAEIQLWKSK